MDSRSTSLDSLNATSCPNIEPDFSTSSSYTTTRSGSSPLTVSPSTSVVSSGSSLGSSSANRCGLCHETYLHPPRVLPCLHTYCQSCLDSYQDSPNKVGCPECQADCLLLPKSYSDLLPDITVNCLLDSDLNSTCDIRITGATSCATTTASVASGAPSPTTATATTVSSSPLVHCTSCKSKTSSAVATCLDCDHSLCPNCVMAHQYMHCFEGHRVVNLQSMNSGAQTGQSLASQEPAINKEESTKSDKMIFCPRHKLETLKYFCRPCSVPICKECTLVDHPPPLHDTDHLSEVGSKQLEALNQTIQESKSKATDIRNMIKNLEHSSGRLQVQYHKAQNEINDTFQFYRSMLEERKQELLKELESVFSAKQMSLTVFGQKAQDTVDKIYQACEFYERLSKHASLVECLMFKKLIDSKLHGLNSFNFEPTLQNAHDLEFVSNYQAIQVGVRNTFGYVRSSGEVNIGPTKQQPPIARPVNGFHLNGNRSNSPPSVIASNNLHNTLTSMTSAGVGNVPVNSATTTTTNDRNFTNGLNSQFENNIISKRFSTANSLGPFSTTVSDINVNGNSYDKWSNGGDLFPTSDYQLLSSHDSMMDISTKLLSTTIFPPKSQIKRQKMIYHCKFGEFGVLEGQFTEPSGVAVNAQNDIIVADTNNHRIQIFDKEGRFKFQFGECGKRDGQLLYPNRVAVVKTSGDIIVTERSPTHQIQIYNQYGQFVRKFGANILQHPRGVTVDSKGRIIVIECKVMRVIIFDQSGNVLQKFGCSKHLEFPNGVVVNDKQEIFISDNRAHCVKVFNYEGIFLRQIGSEGVTNYPIGVGINSAGEILIADNHNNFNLTIFTQDGQLVSALESKVKHAQCFDVALMDDGSVVLASKDYRLYIYRYVQIPPIGL
ncbi:tripartite motif-containing protein brain tumor isoform X2 [Rhodnius prolixus]